MAVMTIKNQMLEYYIYKFWDSKIKDTWVSGTKQSKDCGFGVAREKRKLGGNGVVSKIELYYSLQVL